MVTFRKTAAALLGAVLLLIGSSGSAFALSGQVEYTGGAEKFVFLPQSDLFASMKNLVPGAVATEDITIRNSSARADLYLSSQGGDELLSHLSLTISLLTPSGNETLIYTGPANGTTDGFVHLGNYQNGQTAVLRATLSVPHDIGNSFMNASARVRWVFAATVHKSFDDDSDDDDDSITVVVPPVITPITKAGVLPKTGSTDLSQVLDDADY